MKLDDIIISDIARSSAEAFVAENGPGAPQGSWVIREWSGVKSDSPFIIGHFDRWYREFVKGCMPSREPK